jgi:hypothetical protein
VGNQINEQKFLIRISVLKGKMKEDGREILEREDGVDSASCVPSLQLFA